MSRPFFGSSTPIPFAHRGGAKRWPENTLVAFRNAAELGYQHIETDVHETSDGELVLFHDPTLDRTTNGRGNLADCTLAELKRLDAGYHFVEDGSYTFRDADVRIPTLEEALELDPSIRYNLEVKPEDPKIAKHLWDFVEHHGIHDRVLVASGVTAGAAWQRPPDERARWPFGRTCCLARGETPFSPMMRCKSLRRFAEWMSSPHNSWKLRTTMASRFTCGPSTTRCRCSSSSTEVWTAS
jgi:hypothetical protein